MDPLLRSTLETQSSSSPSPACLDAATLAAWSDDALSRRERAAAEAHAAACARCQSMLAAMARTAPPVAHAAWWRASTLRWLVPLTAGAAAVALWIAVPGRRAGVVEKPVIVDQAKDARAKADEKPPAAPPVTPPAGPAEPRLSAPAREPAPAPAEPRKLEAHRDESGLRKAAPPENAPASAAESMTATAQAPARDAMTMQRRAFSDARTVDVSSPDPNVRWRTTPNPGVVQRSIDGGRTWTSQTTGADGTIGAGSSPAPTVCWLVGRSGLVLLTTDGATWTRLDFPNVLDLQAVQASDDENAIVTAANGRSFATTDGGRTWVERAPQDFPAAPF